ncbi:MAG: outer membrane lipoprotein LolB [Pseudomonadota bacterium]
MSKSLFCIVILLLFLSGCRSLDVGETQPDFVSSGKVSLKTPNQARSGRFSWEEYRADANGVHYVLEVWGPLGQGRTRLAGTDEFLEIIQNGKILAQGESQLLMLEHLGWSVPLDVLSAWIKGAPHPDTPFDEMATEPGARLFNQARWQVTLSRFEGVHPTRISAVRGTLKVLLVSRPGRNQ